MYDVHAAPQPRSKDPVAGAKPAPLYPVAGVCGALGRFDRARVARLAATTGAGLREVHRDRRSVLWLDREPIRWRGPAEQGLAWSESSRPPASAHAWTDAAGDLDACGLVLRGRRRWMHSSASGLAPVYWLEEDGATYFCSRIDPLVQLASRRLRPDWMAWAAILRLGYAVGARTPFEEIRRLEHSSSLELGPSGPIASVRRWPWAEQELLDEGSSLDELTGALEAELGALREREIVLGLSGGADSRLILAGLVGSGAPSVRAVTMPGNWGRDDDERLAVRAAAATGVPHRLLPLAEADYWRDADAFAAATEYQQALEWAWFGPLVRGFGAAAGAIAVDGLAGDILVHGKYATAEALDAVDARTASEHVWKRLHRGRTGRHLIGARMERAITAAAREQIDAVSERLDGHPAAFTLALYRTRTTRGMSGGVAALGRTLPTSAPFVVDAVARAAMRCPPRDKLGGAFHQAAIGRLSPQLAEIPVTSYDFTPSDPSMPERRRGEEALAGFQELLAESPFRRWFRGPLREAVESGSPSALGALGPQRLINGYALHALWMRRYGDRLRSASPRNLLG